MFSFILLQRECLQKIEEMFCCQLNLVAVTSSAGLVQIPCNFSDSGQAAPAAAAAIISSIITDAEGGWAFLNTTTAWLSPWLARSAQVNSMRWVSLCVFAVPVLGSRLVVLTLPPSHSLCLGFLSPSHLHAFRWKEININEALASQGSLRVPAQLYQTMCLFVSLALSREARR